MDLKDIMLSEVSRTEKDKLVSSHVYVEPKNIKLIETVGWWRAEGWGKWGDVDRMVQTFSYKMQTFGGCENSMVTIPRWTFENCWESRVVIVLTITKIDNYDNYVRGVHQPYCNNNFTIYICIKSSHCTPYTMFHVNYITRELGNTGK